jgi:hypothetical protein
MAITKQRSMATAEPREEGTSRNRFATFVLLGLLATAAVAVAAVYFNRPPQMGTDEDVFLTVDALYTAVRVKDDVRVAQCEKRLHSYREAGKLPKESADYLDRVIAKAREGRWESAAERLYEFMLAQRREGGPAHVRSHPEPKRDAKGKPVKGNS